MLQAAAPDPATSLCTVARRLNEHACCWQLAAGSSNVIPVQAWGPHQLDIIENAVMLVSWLP